MTHTITPRPQSRTRRAELKRSIRNLLGTNGSGAPSTGRTLRAAHSMTELVYLATNGQLSLELRDASGNRVDFLTAIGAADINPDA